MSGGAIGGSGEVWCSLAEWVDGGFAAVFGCGFLVRSLQRSNASTPLDSRITTRLVTGRTDALTSLANRSSRVGSTSVLLPLGASDRGRVGVAASPRARRCACACLGGSLGLYNLIKPVVDPPRPPVSIQLANAAGSSFPSGHASQSLATFAVLAVVVAALWRPNGLPRALSWPVSAGRTYIWGCTGRCRRRVADRGCVGRADASAGRAGLPLHRWVAWRDEELVLQDAAARVDLARSPPNQRMQLPPLVQPVFCRRCPRL
jgi:hypothetical protein